MNITLYLYCSHLSKNFSACRYVRLRDSGTDTSIHIHIYSYEYKNTVYKVHVRYKSKCYIEHVRVMERIDFDSDYDDNDEMEKKLLRVAVRSYSIKPSVTEHHAYLTGRDVGGLSPRLQVLEVHEHTTMNDFRKCIETVKVNGMMKRPLLYSEILHQIHISQNPFNYPTSVAKYEYRIGIAPRSNPTAVDIPFVVPKELEKYTYALSAPLVDAFPTIVAVPVTQIDPKTNQPPGLDTMKYDKTLFEGLLAEARKRAADARARHDEAPSRPPAKNETDEGT